MLANIPKDTKSFLTWLLYVASNPASYWKRFSRNKSPATTRLVRVTNEPVPRPSTTSFAFSEAKHVSFQLVENINGYRSG